jgi:hypothetical protein
MGSIQLWRTAWAAASLLAIGLASVPARAAELNPCAAKTLNPCDAKRAGSGGVRMASANPCNPCGGAKVDPARFKRPRGTKLASGKHSELVALGEQLWNDRSLGNASVACSTCHYGNYGQMNDSFDEPYPHYVAMPAQQASVSEVSAAEMVNFCMIVPMQGEPLPWQSRELAALAAYVERIQAGFEPGAGGAVAANPCNPCGAGKMANPCNPCGAGKMANPCNPCGAGKPANPCNPCSRKRNPCDPR